MNAETGAVYALGEDVARVFYHGVPAAAPASVPEFERRLGRQLDDDERAAVEARQLGQEVVPISDRVAQQLKVGDRELKRRKRRAQAQARKRNRR